MKFDHIIHHFKFDKDEFYFQFNSHPSHPSALALSDTLNFMGLKNDAYKLSKEYWDELPNEYIALVDNSFALVTKKGTEFTVFSDTVKNMNKEDLYNTSADFVLLYEKTDKVKTGSALNFKPFVYFIFIAVTIYSFWQFTWYEAFFNLLSLTGLYISMELFSQKFGGHSNVVSNICGGSADSTSTNTCTNIFSSDKVDILGLKLSDFSLIYFLGITFTGLLFPQSQAFLKTATLLSIFIICYSLYTQLAIVRSLCRICLVINIILIGQIVLSSFYFNWFLNISSIFTSIALFTSIFLGTAFLNNEIKQKEELKKSNATNLRFKRNYELFKSELVSGPIINFSDQQTFFVGNKNAKLHIAVVSNPYCGFCKDAHKIIEDLLSDYPDEISAQIRFNYSSEKADEKYTELISAFLSIYKKLPQKDFLKALDSWFTNKNEENIKSIAGGGTDRSLIKFDEIGKENLESGLNFTPVLIINGYQFPSKYDREDIFYFINELIEDDDITNLNTVKSNYISI